MVSWICIESLHCSSFARPFCVVAAVFLANFRVDQVWNMETCVEHGDVCSSDCSLNTLSCPRGGILVTYLRLLFALLPPICAIHSRKGHLLKFKLFLSSVRVHK